MAIVFHAVALDLDGTLTVDGQLYGEALSAIGRVRSHGVRALLVTGRTLAHLDQDFTGLRNRFDAVVAENGAVVASSTGNRLLAAPVDPVLADALTRRGVTTDVGRCCSTAPAGTISPRWRRPPGSGSTTSSCTTAVR